MFGESLKSNQTCLPTTMFLVHTKVVNSSANLLEACKYGDVSRLIISSNTDVNYYNEVSTPLNTALHYQNFNVARYLLNEPTPLCLFSKQH